MTIRTYRVVSFFLAAAFGVVGLAFLFLSSDVLALFNEVAAAAEFERTGTHGHQFFVILSVAYMYVVTLLASLMYLRPENVTYPRLLINAKAASSILSFLVFFLAAPVFICLVNGIIDALIAVLVITMYRGVRRALQ